MNFDLGRESSSEQKNITAEARRKNRFKAGMRAGILKVFTLTLANSRETDSVRETRIPEILVFKPVKKTNK